MWKNIILDDDIIKRNKIGIVIFDKNWKKLFLDNMSRSMKKKVQTLDELCKNKLNAEDSLKMCKKQKKQILKMILELSDNINNKNNGSLLKLENLKEKIVYINDKIDEYEFQLEILPKEIRKLNREILEESTHIAYKSIEEESKRIEEITKEMNKLRQILGGLRDEKISLEESVNDVYEYIHNTLGHSIVNKYDKQYLEEAD